MEIIWTMSRNSLSTAFLFFCLVFLNAGVCSPSDTKDSSAHSTIINLKTQIDSLRNRIDSLLQSNTMLALQLNEAIKFYEDSAKHNIDISGVTINVSAILIGAVGLIVTILNALFLYIGHQARENIHNAVKEEVEAAEDRMHRVVSNILDSSVAKIDNLKESQKYSDDLLEIFSAINQEQSKAHLAKMFEADIESGKTDRMVAGVRGLEYLGDLSHISKLSEIRDDESLPGNLREDAARAVEKLRRKGTP